MDNSLRQKEREAPRKPGGFLAVLFLVWLMRLFQLTEEEQEEAGIYIGRLNHWQ